MSKRTIVAATATAALALPAAATAAVPRSTAHRYEADYHAVAQKFGPRAPGRNIIKRGLANGRRANTSDVLHSIAVLERMLHPAPVVHATYTPAPAPAPAPAPEPAPATTSTSSTTSSSSTSTQPAATPSTSSGGYVIPSRVVQCESGGNPNAVSPYTGGGLYGILDSSWQAFGGTAYAPHPYDASPSQQGAIASKILASQGPSAWSCWK
jgi:hypothetical protein